MQIRMRPVSFLIGAIYIYTNAHVDETVERKGDDKTER